jgi:DNA-binding IclR family transcriptional regulator
MAAQSKRWILEYIEHGLLSCTGRTVTSPDDLMRALEAVRKQGLACSKEELVPGTGGLAVEVRDASGRVVGSLVLISPVLDLTDLSVQRWLPLLRSAVAAVSRLLASGWRERFAQSQQYE